MSAVRFETRSGIVEGAHEDGVSVFRGIPYAAPPVGERRFSAPQREAAWAGARDATSFGPPAPQRPGLMARLLGVPLVNVSEDCLSLNVYTPGQGEARRPLLVWIHGGSFTSGTGGSPLYDGAPLARRGDVVVVSVSYRLGALGFLAHPALARDGEPPPGNRGLLDQIAALEWVREHASALGGDPERITVFGESAGAMAAATLLGVPAARGLFQRVALQSGAAENVSRREEAERTAVHFAGELGLDAASAGRGFRELPFEKLLDAQERTVAARWRDVTGLTFQPVIDGAVVEGHPLAAVRDAAARGIDLLVGTNRDEYRLWAPTDPKAATLDWEGLRRRLARNLPEADAHGLAWADRVLDTYRTLRPREAPGALWFAIETDRLFRAPALRLAEAQAAHHAETWVYHFTWPSPALEGVLGSCHALEIPFVFGTHAQAGIRSFTGEGRAVDRLAARMQEAWIAFAHSGSPRTDALPGWAPYSAAARVTQTLGEEFPHYEAPSDEERRLWEELAAAAPL